MKEMIFNCAKCQIFGSRQWNYAYNVKLKRNEENVPTPAEP